jgi:hypothetical protein
MTLFKQYHQQQDTLPPLTASTDTFSSPLTKKAGTSRISCCRQEDGNTCKNQWAIKLSATSDNWCRNSNFVIEGNENARKIVDDILCWGATMQELMTNLTQSYLDAKQSALLYPSKSLR